MEHYLNFSNTNIWSEIWPELALALAAIVLLGIDLFRKSDKPIVSIGSLAIVFQAGLLIFHFLIILLGTIHLTGKLFLACFIREFRVM